MCGKTVTLAEPVFDGSASLVAVMVTGFGEGTPAGARYSMLPPLVASSGWQGFDPAAQICPTAVFPPGTPLTCQVTVSFGVLLAVAAKVCAPPMASIALAGAMTTVIPEKIAMVTLAETDGAALLCAWTVTLPP